MCKEWVKDENISLREWFIPNATEIVFVLKCWRNFQKISTCYIGGKKQNTRNGKSFFFQVKIFFFFPGFLGIFSFSLSIPWILWANFEFPDYSRLSLRHMNPDCLKIDIFHGYGKKNDLPQSYSYLKWKLLNGRLEPKSTHIVWLILSKKKSN